MRKGFTLIEILVVLVLIALAFIAFAPLYTTLVTDIPQSHRIVNTNASVLSMLRWVRKDIDAAMQLPQSFAGHAANDELLLIELPGGVICYKLQDGKVLRQKLSEAGQRGAGADEVWSVPNAKVKWLVWRKNGSGYAVEVNTHIEQQIRGNMQKKMANSRLYFVGAIGGVLE